jgi:hypothetical protein
MGDDNEDFDTTDPYNYDAEDALYCVGGPLPDELDPEEVMLYAAVCEGVGA